MSCQAGEASWVTSWFKFSTELNELHLSSRIGKTWGRELSPSLPISGKQIEMVRKPIKPAITTAFPNFWHSDIFRRDASTSAQTHPNLLQELKLIWSFSGECKQSSLVSFLHVSCIKESGLGLREWYVLMHRRASTHFICVSSFLKSTVYDKLSKKGKNPNRLRSLLSRACFRFRVEVVQLAATVCVLGNASSTQWGELKPDEGVRLFEGFQRIP